MSRPAFRPLSHAARVALALGLLVPALACSGGDAATGPSGSTIVSDVSLPPTSNRANDPNVTFAPAPTEARRTTTTTTTTTIPTTTTTTTTTTIPTTTTTTTAPPPTTTTSAPAATNRALRIEDFAFEPASMQIRAGTRVTATNVDDATHTWTSTDAVWDSGRLDEGDSFLHAFETPGSFEYRCTIHPAMEGTITVTPVG